MSKKRFDYSIIEFVPDVARGEFVNIGIVLTDPVRPDWIRVCIVADLSRARWLAGNDVVVERCEIILRDHGERILRAGGLDSYCARLFSGSVLQLRKPAPILAVDDVHALDELMDLC